MLTLEHIQKSYPVGKQMLHVLKGISLHVEKGEMLSIMGSSGSGKSTLLNILGFLDVHDSGEYILNGTRIKELSEKRAAQLRNQYLGFVFQSFHLISFKTALENVALPLYYSGVKRAVRQEQALEMLEKVGLKDWAHHLPSELSGGQKQRVAIARALVTKPSILLADEPTGALDSASSENVMRILQEVNEEGQTVIIVTHEDEIAACTKRNIFLKDGTIVSDKRIKQKCLI